MDTTDPFPGWVASAREGNREALESLVRAVQDQLYALAMRMLGDPADAQDAKPRTFTDPAQAGPDFLIQGEYEGKIGNDTVGGAQVIALGERDCSVQRRNQKIIEDMCDKSYGIILVTGPTGSGKSTTLYSILNKINTGDKNIITIEDPVEYELDGINQCGVNVRAGMTFSAGLRAMLRQDPDVIMVGEMRDTETATIAMEAALTGHLVLSTLHTNDAPSAPTRLIDMEVEPFLISSSIICVMAQRLVRMICPSCKESYHTSRESLLRYGFPLPEEIGADTGGELTLFRGRGCEKCAHTGYRGRTGVHEVLVFTDDVRDKILEKCPSHVIRNLAIGHGMKTLQSDAVQKILNGVTSVDEVLRVIYA